MKQLPAVIEGKKSKKQALLDAGYSKGSANQQNAAFGSIRSSTAMQEALEKAGVTEEKLAGVIADGLKAEKVISADDEVIRDPDHHARHKFLVTAAELRDDFPAKKTITADATLDDIIKSQEAK